MYLIIDHNDSFVYNLKTYFEVSGYSVEVIPVDRVTVDHIERIENLEGIIFSPGPKRPEDYEKSASILRAFCSCIPVLGVCLGHQLMAYAFGAKVVKGLHPMHGKLTRINNYKTGLLSGLPDEFFVTRYHSLMVSEHSLPECLQIDAKAEDGAVMAISHKSYPLFGVQFHPEAVLSQYGYEIIKNFGTQCEKRRKE